MKTVKFGEGLKSFVCAYFVYFTLPSSGKFLNFAAGLGSSGKFSNLRGGVCGEVS
jgi:hypothetical protein